MQQASGEGPQGLSDEAADWLGLLAEDDSEENRARFSEWLTRSPAHVRALLETTAAICELARLDEERDAAARAILRRARAGALGRWVRSPKQSLRVLLGYWKWLSVGLVGGVATCVAIEVFFSAAGPEMTLTQEADYVLGASSTMHLNRGGRAEIYEYAEGRGREVRLLEGEASFSGEHDASRPLRVLVDRFSIDVVGTQFRVIRRGSDVRVSVESGEVVFGSHCDPDQAVPGRGLFHHESVEGMVPVLHLVKGEAAVGAAANCSMRLEAKNPELPVPAVRQPVREKWLEFRSTSIEKAVSLFNQYNAHSRVVVDSVIGRRLIGGAFRASDVDTFVNVLRMTFGARVARKTLNGVTVTYISAGR